jgi:nicotinamide mononucleotide transporter
MSYLNYMIEIGPVKTTVIELIAVFFGLLSVWSMKKESILAFPFGIINVSIYVYICFTQRLYALAMINVFFAFMSIYGWINWAWKGAGEESLKITKCSRKELLLNSLAVIVFFVALRIVLVKVTDSVVPSWDSITTSLYIVGMWLLARKKVENWIAWIAGDVISTFLFAYQGLYFSSFQFFVFTLIAISGFFEWRKKILRSTG